MMSSRVQEKKTLLHRCRNLISNMYKLIKMVSIKSKLIRKGERFISKLEI
jgi:hypothetical protein